MLELLAPDLAAVLGAARVAAIEADVAAGRAVDWAAVIQEALERQAQDRSVGQDLRQLLAGCDRRHLVPALAMLAKQGAPVELLTELAFHELIGVAQVTVGGSGLWELGGPDRRLLLGVCEWGEPVDVLALSSTCEDEWALWRGDAPLLGWNAWLDAHQGLETRLRVWPTPLAWLRGGGSGICVLRWDAEALGMLRMLGEGVRLLVEPAAKERLRALLAYGGLPRVEAAEARPMGQGRMAA